MPHGAVGSTILGAVIRSRRLVRASAPLLVSLAIALPALGLTSCRSKDVIGQGPAAVVDGHEISRDSVLHLVEAQKRQLKKQGGSGATGIREIAGSGQDTVDATTFSYALTQLVQDQITAAALLKAGVSSKQYEAKARTDLAGQVQGGQAALDKIDKVLVDAKVRSDSLTAGLSDVLKKEASPTDRDQQVRDLYPQVRASSPDCVSVILATDEIGAKAAKASVDAGGDFASVASQLSTDAQSAQQGGFLGCTTPDQIQKQLNIDVTSLKAGAVVGPIAVPNQGYLLLRLDSTTGPTLAQARPQIERQLQAQSSGSAALAARQASLQRRAKVQVDPRYGTWDPKSGTVEPPKGPLSTTTTVPAAPAPSGNP